MSLLQLSRLAVERSATFRRQYPPNSRKQYRITRPDKSTSRIFKSPRHGNKPREEQNFLMLNSKNNDKCAKIYMDGILLEDVKIFKYLGATLKSDGASGNELRIRIATAISAMIRLNIIWTSTNIGFKIK